MASTHIHHADQEVRVTAHNHEAQSLLGQCWVTVFTGHDQVTFQLASKEAANELVQKMDRAVAGLFPPTDATPDDTFELAPVRSGKRCGTRRPATVAANEQAQ